MPFGSREEYDDREEAAERESLSHCYAVGRPDDGSFTIHVNGELRGKYANAETLHVHAAEMMREIERLRNVMSVLHAEMDSAWNRDAVSRDHAHRWGEVIRKAIDPSAERQR